MGFLQKLDAAVDKNNSLLCVGLDPDASKIPVSQKSYFDFNKAIIDATAGTVCAFKPNLAFYEEKGAEGIKQLEQTCQYIRERYPDIPIILDFKNGDIGNTNNYYAGFAFRHLQVDAITIQPYEGQKALQPFLDCKEKGIIVLCKMSDEGSGEFQDLEVNGRKLFLEVADRVATKWNANGNCLLVVGATYPDDLAQVRQLAGDMTILVPGIGAQGGDIEAALKAGLNSDGKGLIINSSRAILYASDGEDFAEAAGAAATKMRDEINQYRSAS